MDEELDWRNIPIATGPSAAPRGDSSSTAGADVPVVITLSPIALGIGFVCLHAIAIRSRPHANISAASLGGWTRIAIVLMFVWSALITGLVVMLKAEMTAGSTSQLVSVTYGPIVALWLLYFAVRWVRAGFRS